MYSDVWKYNCFYKVGIHVNRGITYRGKSLQLYMMDTTYIVNVDFV